MAACTLTSSAAAPEFLTRIVAERDIEGGVAEVHGAARSDPRFQELLDRYGLDFEYIDDYGMGTSGLANVPARITTDGAGCLAPEAAGGPRQGHDALDLFLDRLPTQARPQVAETSCQVRQMGPTTDII